MTPPRHPTRPFGPDDDRTPTPQPPMVDADTARLISRDEIGSHAKDCPMIEWLRNLENKQRADAEKVENMRLEMATAKGAAQEAARSAGLRSALITSLVVIAAQAAMFLAARVWPTRAEARVSADHPALVVPK